MTRRAARRRHRHRRHQGAGRRGRRRRHGSPYRAGVRRPAGWWTSRLVEDALTEAALAVAAAAVAAVGLAAAGFVDATGERVTFAPHLPWRDDPVRGPAGRALGHPVALDNDANCVARAEAAYGAARGAASALVVTLGTGIGGAVLLDGLVLSRPQRDGRRVRPHAGGAGRAAVRVRRPGLLGAVLQRQRAGPDRPGAAGPEPTLLDELCGGDPARLTGPMVTQAAEEGDLVARQAFASVGDWLGRRRRQPGRRLRPGGRGGRRRGLRRR